MAPPVYEYLCAIELSSIDVTVDDVPNPEVKALMEEVQVQEYSSHTVLYFCHLALPFVNEHVFRPVVRFIAIFLFLTRSTMPQTSQV